MKKQLIAVVSALAMTFTSLPCVSIAAENVPKPVLQYTFDGNKQLAAKLLDIGRTKPYTQMKEYGIKKNDS